MGFAGCTSPLSRTERNALGDERAASLLLVAHGSRLRDDTAAKKLVMALSADFAEVAWSVLRGRPTPQEVLAGMSGALIHVVPMLMGLRRDRRTGFSVAASDRRAFPATHPAAGRRSSRVGEPDLRARQENRSRQAVRAARHGRHPGRSRECPESCPSYCDPPARKPSPGAWLLHGRAPLRISVSIPANRRLARPHALPKRHCHSVFPDNRDARSNRSASASLHGQGARRLAGDETIVGRATPRRSLARPRGSHP
jgi:hypothetical protein